MSGTHSSAMDRSEPNDISRTSTHVHEPSDYMGILSLTLSPSPVVRWILPARIRSRKHNDVVFIGSTYIQLREFHDNGQLSDATAKLDLGTQILGAKVISAKVKMTSKLDEMFKQEWDEEQFLVKGKECVDGQPPQIVVLMTASNELIYLYAKDSDTTNRVEFVFAKRALLEDVSIPKTHIRHTAIDHESKIMATASWNTCTVFSLKEVDDLKTCIDAWDPRVPQSFQPNHEQRMFQVDGHIMKMDFLRPSEDEPDKAILLLIVATTGATVLLLYKWDTKEPISQLRPMDTNGQGLSKDDEFPLLLIPSRKARSFMLVTQTSMVFYDNIKAVNASRTPITLPPDKTGKHDQLWVQWAKPSRHHNYSNQKEDILLVREDGFLRIYSRNHNSPADVPTSFSPGIVNTGVDLAVCVLPGPRRMGGDILIIGGSMTDGGVFHLRPREELNMLQVIPNVSPIHDLAMLDPANSKQKDIQSRRTFATSGVQQTSSLNELRFGHEAQIGWMLPVDECETINRIWTLEHVKSKVLFMLASHPEHTTALAFDLQKQHFENMDHDTYPGLRSDVATLAAAMLPIDTSIVITSNTVAAGFETSSPVVQPLKDCICADIDCDDGTFAVALRVDLNYHTKIGLVRQINDQPSILFASEGYQSPKRPLCLALFHFVKKKYLAVGYADGGIECFSVDADGRLISQTKLGLDEAQTSAVTSIVVQTYPSSPRALLLVGTRTGKLKILRLTVDQNSKEGEIALELDRMYHIGEAPVTVVTEGRGSKGDPLGALIYCGTRLDRIVCFENDCTSDYTLSHVWLANINELTYTPPAINAVHRVANTKSVESTVPSRFVVCATKDDILFAKLIEQEQIVPRRIQLNDRRASLMTYSRIMDKFIITSNPSNWDNTNFKLGNAARRYPTLHIVDSEKAIPDYEDEPTIVLGTYQERVKVLMPWEPTDGKSHYNLIMIGMSDHRNSRLGFISARKLLTSPSTAAFKQLMKFANKKLHAICTVDKSSLAVSVGNDLVLMRLDLSTKKWHEDGRYNLPSPGLSLSAHGTVIYAATEKHSTIVLSWHKVARKWEKLLTDYEAKNARIVLPFGDSGNHFLVAMAVNEGTSVLAYTVKKNPTRKSMPLFEAEMPLAIQHITSIPSSWSDNRQHAFQGVTMDGTIFVFQTLTYAQWKLLRYVQSLANPDPAYPAKKSVALLTERFAHRLSCSAMEETKSRFDPKRMHVRGDVIKRLVDQGPQHLRNLLGAQIKTEDDMSVDNNGSSMAKLECLSRPVLGETSDVPAAVVAWMRRLLRATIF